MKGSRLYGRRASGLYLTNAVATVAGDLNAANWTGSVSVEGGYKHENTNPYYEPLAEKTAEDGTVFWRNLPGGTLIFVR